VLDTTTNRWSSTIYTAYPAYALGLNADGTRLFVGRSSDNLAFTIDTGSRSAVGYSYIGDFMYAVAVHPATGDYYVGRWINRDLVVLDANLRPTRTIAVGCPPFHLAFTPDGHRLYLSCYTDLGAVKVIDPATSRVIGSIPVGGSYTAGAAFSPDGLRAFVASLSNSSGLGLVSVIDVSNGWVTDELASANGGTSFGKITDLGDQYQSLRIEDLALPSGVLVATDASGGPNPAIIEPCGLTNYTFSFRAGSSGEIYCGSADLRVLTGTVGVGFKTPEGTQGGSVLNLLFRL